MDSIGLRVEEINLDLTFEVDSCEIGFGIQQVNLGIMAAQDGLYLNTNPSSTPQTGTPTPADQTPNQEEHTAATAISGGRLVRLTPTGLAYYDPSEVGQAYSLLGVSLNAAAPGALVKVQTGGVVTEYGWGLTPGQIYRAGLNGFLNTSVPAGAVFSQIVGVAITPDTLNFQPQTIIFSL